MPHSHRAAIGILMCSADHPDPFQLKRFVTAQEGTYEQALAEIRRGSKCSHWMWYIFPQIGGLGKSAAAQHFAIRSLAEAQEYLAHPLLGSRYEECVNALQDLVGTSAEQVLGPVDALKLRSSLTLFARGSSNPLYHAALTRWFGGPDDATDAILARGT